MKTFKVLLLVPAVVLAAACGRNGSRADDALKNDLALASQAQAYMPQQFMSPAEMAAAQAYNPYAPQQYQPVARQPVYATPNPVRRVSTTRRSTGGSSSGGYVIREQPTQVVKHTNRDAAIGAAAGAIIGATTSRDKVKGGLIGAAAGGILGEPVEVINMPKTGLPVPANSEIAFEGFIHPGDNIQEGPLGEWTGYYASGSALEPAIRIATFMHRNDPILMGAIPAVPPNDNTFYLGTYRCGAVWNQLEAAGIPEVRGVWAHEAGGSRFMLVISIKTLYGGHSKQAAMVAAHCHAGAYCNRWTIVVDEDIDPTNVNDVIWAMCTRCDPRDQVDVIHGGWSSALDPMCYDTEADRRNSRVVIDACIPFRRKKTFPTIARSSKALDDRIRAKWAKDLPKGFS